MSGDSGPRTFLFTDIEGSTRLWEAHPEHMGATIARHDELLRSVVEAAGGSVFKTVGDAVCAVFASTRGAVVAATAAQAAMRSEPWTPLTPIRVRMAVHTGECEERGGDFFGPTLNRVARLLGLAHGGQTLVSGVSALLVQGRLPPEVELLDLGAHRLKDLGQPEHVFQLSTRGACETFAPLRDPVATTPPHNLPREVTTFIGRASDVEDVTAALAGGSLVTLCGPGGVGKSRLAVRVARDVLVDYSDGVVLVELAPVGEGTAVTTAVAAAAGLQPTPDIPVVEAIVGAFADRTALLVLDNCEHVVDDVAALAEALTSRCAVVQLLVTSREPLGVPGERVVRIAPLPLPPDDADPAEVLDADAVRLILDRARLHDPAFTASDGDAAVFADIARRLDGIPLALELAAARLRTMTPSELADRLRARLDLLGSGRRTNVPHHRTLWATIDWSFHLLDDAERTLFTSMAVFRGGWTLDAVEAVCGDVCGASPAVDVLTTLVDKSLVQAERVADRTRYRFLETVRQFAEEQLGIAESMRRRVQDRHLEHYLALAAQAEPHLNGVDQRAWLDRLDADHGNLRAALAHALASDRDDEALRLAGALFPFWWTRGHWAEGARMLGGLLHTTVGTTRARGAALVGAAELLGDAADYEQARACAEEALEIARRLDDVDLVIRSLDVLALVHVDVGAVGDALRLQDEATLLAHTSDDDRLRARLMHSRAQILYALGRDGEARSASADAALLARRAGDLRLCGAALNNLGVHELADRELDAAAGHLAEAAELAEAINDPSVRGAIELNRATAAVLRGRPQDALAHLVVSVPLARRIGDRKHVAYGLLVHALVASLAGDDTRAAILHGAVDAEVARLGHAFEPLEAELRRSDLEALHARLDDVTFRAAHAHGVTLDVGAALAYADVPEAPRGH